MNTHSSCQMQASVSYAEGGSLTEVFFEDSETRDCSGPPHGGGIRGKVKGFSRASRNNLLRRFARINRTAFRAYKGKVFAITLTYPHEYPEDPHVSKRHLRALHKRLKSCY